MADTTSINDLPISPQTDHGQGHSNGPGHNSQGHNSQGHNSQGPTPNNIAFDTTEKNQVIADPTKHLAEQRELEDKKNAGIQHTQNVVNGALPPTGAPPPSGNVQHVAAKPPSTANMNEFVSGIQSAAASGALGLPSRDIPQQQTHLTHDAVTKPNYVPQGPDDYILKHQTQEEIINQHNAREKQGENADAIYDELQAPILVGALYFIFQLPAVKKQMMRLLPTIFLKDGNLNLSGYITYSIMFSGMYYASIRTVNYLSL